MEKYGRVEQATDDNRVRHMNFACWINKATNTHSEYINTHCFSTTTMVTGTRLNIAFIRTLPVLFLTAVTQQLMLNINVFDYMKHDIDLTCIWSMNMTTMKTLD